MKKSYQNIIIILLCSIVIMLPMILNSYRIGHDTEYHVANVVTLKEQLTNNLSTFIMPKIAGNFGYGTRLFYPILSHTVVAITSIITGLEILNAFKLTHLIVLFLSGLTLYFLAKKISKDNKIALISSIIYMTFPYHIADIYVRDALAECFVFVFIPLVFLGLQYLFEDKRKFYIFFTIGYVGGMLSHFTLMIYLTLFLIPYFIINRKKVFKKNIIITLIITALTILFITSPSLINMIEHKFFGNYAVFLAGHMAGSIWGCGLKPWNYFLVFQNFNAFEIKYYIDILVLILLYMTYKNRKKINFKNHKYIIIFGLIAMFMSTVLFPWDIMPQFLRMIQFPWRFETFVALSVSLVAPLCLNLEKMKKIPYYVIILCLLFFGYLNTNKQSPRVFDFNNYSFANGMGWQKEYLPVNTLNNSDYIYQRGDGLILESGVAEIIEDKTPKLSFNFIGNSVVELPRIYYLGYVLKDKDGNKVEIKENSNGFIEAQLVTNTYYLDYEGTKAYNICLKLSIVACIIYVLLCFKGVIWKKLVS